MINVNVLGGELDQKEIDYYVSHGKKKYPDRVIKSMDLTVDGDYIDAKYYFDDVPFERIRRITGYLVGTMDRFNNAKKAEVYDRVKHNVWLATSAYRYFEPTCMHFSYFT